MVQRTARMHSVRKSRGRATGGLHLSRGAGRAGGRRRIAAPRNDRVKVGDRCRSRCWRRRWSMRGSRGGFRLRSPASTRCAAVSSTSSPFREQTLPTGFLRRRGRLDPPLQDLEPALRRQAGRGGDHPRPERFCRGAVSLARLRARSSCWFYDADYVLRRVNDLRRKVLRTWSNPRDRHAADEPQLLWRTWPGCRIFLLRDNLTERPADATVAFARRPSPNSTRISRCWPTT